MQTRRSLYTGDRPLCPVDPKHAVHRHDQYDRYANCDEQTKSLWIPRFLCYVCRYTISVLPDETLPYRAVSVPLMQSSFDAKASDQPEPVVTENERGCLRRAWLRFAQRIAALAAVLGQVMQIRRSDAKLTWPQLRRLGSLKQILHLLGRKYKTSLLADYLCLKPWAARPNPGG
jgi:hypothetical protein